MSSKKKFLIIILGPTGIGKTDLTIELAKTFNSEIISCDSRQFYKELNIGTAVPEKEQLEAVKHHFIQNISITDYYNVSNFENDVINFLKTYHKKNKIALMTGGSMMYIDAVCNGIDEMPDIDPDIREFYKEKLKNDGIESLRFELKLVDPEHYNIVDLKNGKRIIRALEVCAQTGKTYTSFRTAPKKERDFEIIKIGLQIEREKLYERINKRVDIMIENGLIDEVKANLKNRNLNALNTVGYKELFAYFDGEYSLEKAIELIKRNTRHYSRRQISWFNRDKEINWFNPNNFEEIKTFIEEKLQSSLPY